MVLPVRWTAGGVWNRQDHTTVGISGNFEQLEYVSNNLPPSLVSSLRWPSSVAEADLCKGQSSGGAPAQPPQSLTSPSFCNRTRSLSKLSSSGAKEKWLNTESPEPGASARWQSLIYSPAPNGLSAIPVLTCLLRDTMQKQPDIFYFRLFCWESFALKTGLLAAIATLTNAWYTCDVSVKS